MYNPQTDTAWAAILPGALLLTALDKLRRMLPHMPLSVQARHCFIMTGLSCERPRGFSVGIFLEVFPCLMELCLAGEAAPCKDGMVEQELCEKILKIVPTWDLLLQFHYGLRNPTQAAWKNDPHIHSLNRFTSIETRGT